MYETASIPGIPRTISYISKGKIIGHDRHTCLGRFVDNSTWDSGRRGGESNAESTGKSAAICRAIRQSLVIRREKMNVKV